MSTHSQATDAGSAIDIIINRSVNSASLCFVVHHLSGSALAKEEKLKLPMDGLLSSLPDGGKNLLGSALIAILTSQDSSAERPESSVEQTKSGEQANKQLLPSTSTQQIVLADRNASPTVIGRTRQTDPRLRNRPLPPPVDANRLVSPPVPAAATPAEHSPPRQLVVPERSVDLSPPPLASIPSPAAPTSPVPTGVLSPCHSGMADECNPPKEIPLTTIINSPLLCSSPNRLPNPLQSGSADMELDESFVAGPIDMEVETSLHVDMASPVKLQYSSFGFSASRFSCRFNRLVDECTGRDTSARRHGGSGEGLASPSRDLPSSSAVAPSRPLDGYSCTVNEEEIREDDAHRSSSYSIGADARATAYEEGEEGEVIDDEDSSDTSTTTTTTDRLDGIRLSPSRSYSIVSSERSANCSFTATDNQISSPSYSDTKGSGRRNSGENRLSESAYIPISSSGYDWVPAPPLPSTLADSAHRGHHSRQSSSTATSSTQRGLCGSPPTIAPTTVVGHPFHPDDEYKLVDHVHSSSSAENSDRSLYEVDSSLEDEDMRITAVYYNRRRPQSTSSPSPWSPNRSNFRGPSDGHVYAAQNSSTHSSSVPCAVRDIDYRIPAVSDGSAAGHNKRQRSLLLPPDHTTTTLPKYSIYQPSSNVDDYRRITPYSLSGRRRPVEDYDARYEHVNSPASAVRPQQRRKFSSDHVGDGEIERVTSTTKRRPSRFSDHPPLLPTPLLSNPPVSRVMPSAHALLPGGIASAAPVPTATRQSGINLPNLMGSPPYT